MKLKNYHLAIIMTLLLGGFAFHSCQKEKAEAQPEVLFATMQQENPEVYDALYQFGKSLIQMQNLQLEQVDIGLGEPSIEIRDQVKFDTAANSLVVRGQSFLTDPKIELVQKSGNGWSLASKDNALVLNMTQVQGRLPFQIYVTVNGQLAGVVPFFRFR